MIIDTSINQFIDAELLRANEEREATHEPSGKLSASMLYMPLRFQLYKAIGVPRKPMEAYVLGKFKRGNDVEDWYVGMMDKAGFVLERQKRVEYRGAVGFIDALVDSEKMLFKASTMPHEVKSVTNAKLKRIAATGVDYHYQLQACFYALAIGSTHYAVDIVSAEDLRPNVYIFETKSMSADVEECITRYQTALDIWEKTKELPPFEPNPKVPWTSNLEYAPYDIMWIQASDKEVMEMLEKEGK